MTITVNVTAVTLGTSSAPVIEGATPGTFGTYGGGVGFSHTAALGRVACRIALSSRTDFTTHDFIAFQFYNEAPFGFQNTDTYANGGRRIIFVDSGGNYAGFNLYGSGVPNYADSAPGAFDGFPVSFQNISSSNIRQTAWHVARTRTPDISSGTMDWTQVDYVEISVKTTASVTTKMSLGALAKHNGVTLTGTATLAALMSGYTTTYDPQLVMRTPYSVQSAASIDYVIKTKLEIGDGSTATNWTESDFGLGFFTTYDKSPTFRSAGPMVLLDDNNTREIEINQSASCTMTLDDFTLASGAYWQWNLHGSGTATLTRGTFWRADGFIAGHGTYTDCAWNECEAAIQCSASTTITRGTVRDGVGHGIQITGAAGDYGALDIAFDNNSTYDIELGSGGAGTYTLDGISVIGSYTLKIRNDSATNAVVVEIPSGITYSASTAGGSLTVSTPTVTADISITSIPTAVGADRRLQIINSTAAAASAWQASTVYAAGAVVLRTSGVGSESTAGLYMRCTGSGTSGGTEPTWDTTVGNTTADNTVTWTTYAVLFYDADPAASSYATTYVDGEEFLAGEEVAIRCAEMDGSTSFKTYSTAVIAATTGFSALVSEESDTVFATYALDGSSYDTTFSPNYAANYIVLDTNTDFSGASAYAYYCWLLTTTDGMYRFWGGLTALDTGNIRNNNSVISLYFDESAGFVKQTDNVRIFRNDGARPAIDPTTGGNGIEINWRVPVNVVSTGGSALTTEEHDHLMSRPSASATASAVANVAVDGSVTLAESMRLQNSMLGGKVIGAGTGTEVFRSLADDKDRVTVTVDSVGNRSAVVRDLT